MFVKLAADGRISLEDTGNFRAFKLVVDSHSPEAAKKALAGVADFTDDATHAWIFEAALRQRPEVAQDPAWQQGLGAMIEKAKPHGWIDEQKQAIKAHIEWLP